MSLPIFAAGTLGFALNKLMDQVQQTITSAQNAGLNLEVEAGREVSLAIESAKNAFSESLNASMDRIDRTARTTLDHLTSMVQEVQDRNEVALKTIAQRVQQFVNTLPFAHLQPQVTDITPRYIVPSGKDYPVIIKIVGNFLYAAHAGFKPKLLVNGQQFEVSSNTTQELKFTIPVKLLFPSERLSLSNYSYTNAELLVPWEKTAWLGLRTIQELDRYKILIGALPASPGKISFQYSTSRVVIERKTFVDQGHHLASTREAGNNDQIDVPFSVAVESGWHVVRGSSKIVNFCGQGDYTYPHFISDDGDRVIYKASTIHHGIGSSGSIDFSIAFDEYKEITVQDPHVQEISLKWGESVTLTASVGRIIFDAFDRSHHEFNGPDSSNNYIKVKSEGGALVISAADPATLSLRSNMEAARARL